MAVAPANLCGELLADRLQRDKTLSVSQAVGIVRQLAQQIAEQHAAGSLHLSVSPDVVFLDEVNDRTSLRVAPGHPGPFGGADGDEESCPPELQQPSAVRVPTDLTAARETLRSAGLSNVDPRRIDVYQLGALLCRMLTGESVGDFLSSPRVAAKVSEESDRGSVDPKQMLPRMKSRIEHGSENHWRLPNPCFIRVPSVANNAVLACFKNPALRHPC